jgi:hypothetical protein
MVVADKGAVMTVEHPTLTMGEPTGIFRMTIEAIMVTGSGAGWL